jgi:hypothetical protein
MNFDFIGAVFIIIGMVLSAKGRETIKWIKI